MRRLDLEFKTAREEAFKTNLAKGQVTASNVRGSDKGYGGAKALDGISDTYWATDDGVIKASLEIDFGREIEFNRFLAQENIALGQRVKRFSVRIWKDEHYETLAQQTTIGYKRILRFPVVKTRKLQFVIEDSKASPAITNIEIFKAPLEKRRGEGNKNRPLNLRRVLWQRMSEGADSSFRLLTLFLTLSGSWLPTPYVDCIGRINGSS